jgi:sugar phosphate isomerase/epimerase
MEIGLSSASFYPMIETEDSIKLIKSLGFNTGEIFLNTPSEYEEEFIKLLVEKKQKYNFNINSIHSFSSSFEPYLFDSYKRRAKDMLNYYKKICKAGNMLGATCYTFHGMRYANLNTLNIKTIIEKFNELTYIASEEGIKLCQENVSWCMSSELEYLNILKENCKYPLYFTLDIKQAYKSGIAPSKYIDIMGKKISNFHINDRDEEHSCLLPGKGNVNYLELVNNLKKIGYNGKGIIEVYSENYKCYDDLIKAKEFLNKVLEN